MIKMNEDNRNKQIKFERNLITFPYLGFALLSYYLISFIPM